MGFEIRRKASPWSQKCWPAWSMVPQTGYENDSGFHDLYELATEKTQMGVTDNAMRRQRHFTLNYLLQSSLASVEGDVCEVGCWRGLSAYQIAHQVRRAGNKRTFHVFDSFEGLSEYAEVDVPSGRDVDLESMRTHFACPLSQVQENLADFDFIKFYAGWVPDRFSEVGTTGFSFVHIDVDLYQPVKDSFNFFYPRLAGRGIMVFDDYGEQYFPGAKKAIDEVLSEIDSPFFVPLPSGQAFLIKGGAGG